MDGFLILTGPLLLDLLNDPAERHIPNSWSIAPQDAVNVQEPVHVSPQSKASVAMEQIFCMICYYKAYVGKKKKGQTDGNTEFVTDKKEVVVQCLLALFFWPFFVVVVVNFVLVWIFFFFGGAVTLRNCLKGKINK